jgi:hypothetical protein
MNPGWHSLFWARVVARWQAMKHTHSFAGSLTSGCPACRQLIRKEVRLWN